MLSDLHQEFGFCEVSFAGAELVILAGDTNLGTKGVDWVRSAIPAIPVLYLLGNHEYYNGSYPRTLHKILDAAKNCNIHVLENRAVTFDHVTFHGCTLWTDFALFGDPVVYGRICQDRMNDYRMIRKDPSYSRLRSIDTCGIHHASVRWLKASLEASETRRNVVITHHAPGIRSLSDEYRDDPVSAAYASDLEHLIREYQPEYWIHGHIHASSDYRIGATRVICNPHGYLPQPNKAFNGQLVLEL